MLVTWDQPTGVTLDQLWGYQLNFTGDVKYVAATSTMMFYAKDSGITPGSFQGVEITAIYKTMAPSSHLFAQCKLPDACTYVKS